jgi:hypothetical protein
MPPYYLLGIKDLLEFLLILLRIETGNYYLQIYSSLSCRETANVVICESSEFFSCSLNFGLARILPAKALKLHRSSSLIQGSRCFV